MYRDKNQPCIHVAVMKRIDDNKMIKTKITTRKLEVHEQIKTENTKRHKHNPRREVRREELEAQKNVSFALRHLS